MLVRHHRGLSVGSDPAWGQGSRGIVAGGGTPWTSKIEYVTIATTGNAADFGVVHEQAQILGTVHLIYLERLVMAGGLF